MPKLDELENMLKEYSEWFSRFGDSYESVGWNKPKHNIRFKELIQPWASYISDPNEKLISILDLGCGLGHLKEYLDLEFNNFDYSGLDLNREFINQCIIKFPDSKFICSEASNIEGEYDLVLSSGLFNRKFEDSSKFLKETILTSLNSARLGVSFNILSFSALEKNEKNFYCHLKDIEEIVQDRTICSGFKIDGSSIPGELTVTIFKDR
tara:strand:- start:720 stop:1346 length:627 start_codon:yes stop_codon:yes gene_type:complete